MNIHGAQGGGPHTSGHHGPLEGSVGRRGLWPTAGSFNRFQVTLRREQAEGTEGEGQFGNYCVSKTTPEGLPVPADQTQGSGA